MRVATIDFAEGMVDGCMETVDVGCDYIKDVSKLIGEAFNKRLLPSSGAKLPSYSI